MLPTKADLPEIWLDSVGIDIGTSTTKMILSKLRLALKSGPLALPRYAIAERQITYESPVIRTPLLNEEEIDADCIARWLADQYRYAGVEPAAVQTGAVMITGESASKKNAEPIVHQLAQDSGSFVVATAGSDLEADLAAKGSGAVSRSRQVDYIIGNVDIGGGTANTALCCRGKVTDTVTFHVGGRLIRLTGEGQLLYVAPVLQPWLAANGYSIEAGTTVTLQQLKDLAAALNRSMLSFLAGAPDSSAHLLIAGKPPLKPLPLFRELMISGGVGQWVYDSRPDLRTLADVAVFGDIGPLLAYTLRQECDQYGFKLRKPAQTVRATVLGAGMQSTEISGATIHVDGEQLPLRNVPVIRLDITLELFKDEHKLIERIRSALNQASLLYHADMQAGKPFACELTGLSFCSFAALQMLSAQFAAIFRECFPLLPVMVIICEHDLAKALGQSLYLRCRGKPAVICIDQISVEHGDYVDLGEPIAGAMLPVTVKTLAFTSS